MWAKRCEQEWAGVIEELLLTGGGEENLYEVKADNNNKSEKSYIYLESH